MSSSSDRQWRELDIAGADRVTFDLPTRRVIVTRGHNTVVGTPEEIDILVGALVVSIEKARRSEE